MATSLSRGESKLLQSVHSGRKTLVETQACPPGMKRGPRIWNVAELDIIDRLGEGHLSSVVRAVDLLSDTEVAVKMYHKNRMSPLNHRQVAREVEIHSRMQHASCIQLYAAFEDQDGIYLVQEIAPHGDLYSGLSRNAGYLLEPFAAAEVMQPILEGLAYMHDQGIMHRDIKPENILISEDMRVKLGDFGLAINLTQEVPRSRVGTLDYMSPEIVKIPRSGEKVTTDDLPKTKGLRGTYGPEADVWAVGILTYELLMGGPPFEASTREATYKNILEAAPFLPSHWSQAARDFITLALAKKVEDRPTIHQLLKHKWLTMYQSLSPEALQKQGSYNGINSLDIAALSLATHNSLSTVSSTSRSSGLTSYQPSDASSAADGMGYLPRGSAEAGLPERVDQRRSASAVFAEAIELAPAARPPPSRPRRDANKGALEEEIQAALAEFLAEHPEVQARLDAGLGLDETLAAATTGKEVRLPPAAFYVDLSGKLRPVEPGAGAAAADAKGAGKNGELAIPAYRPVKS